MNLPSLFEPTQAIEKPDGERIFRVPLDRIAEFPNHPFHIRDDDKMRELTESISRSGILHPALLLPREDKEGHYRYGSRLNPSSLLRFYTEVNRRGRLFRTSVTLVRAMEDLLDNIAITPLTAEQRLAVHKAQAIVDTIYNRMEDSEDILVDALLRAIYRKA